MDYRLDDLGHYQFERLAQAVIRNLLGARLETWGAGKDLGRDAYSPGPLRYPDPSTLTAGPFIFQVKFVSGANAAGARPESGLVTAVRAEIGRIDRRREAGDWLEPKCYTLVTNVTLSTAIRGRILGELSDALPFAEVILVGATELSADLDNSPQIRLSYPQILGLRDLDHLLHQAVATDVVNRSSMFVRIARRYLDVFVPTSAYYRALEKLEHHGFCVLTGPPEMGKTITAMVIALARLSGGWEAYECRSPSDLFKVYRPDVSQIFIVDDAFGSTEYRPDLGQEWAADLHKILETVDSQHHLIWTSRPGPLREGLGKIHLQGAARGFPDFREVQVDAALLTVPEKAQILYRHARSSGTSADGLAIIRSNGEAIVLDKNFTPLRVARFVSDELPRLLELDSASRAPAIRHATAKAIGAPTPEFAVSFSRLDPEIRATLISMLDFAADIVDIESLGVRASRLLGRTPARSVVDNVGMVEDHFLRQRAAPSPVGRYQ